MTSLLLLLSLLVCGTSASLRSSRKYLWSSDNGYVNLTKVPMTYAPGRHDILKVQVFPVPYKKTARWCRPVIKGYYLANSNDQAVCLSRSKRTIYLTKPLQGTVVPPKECLWRVRHQAVDNVPHIRLFVKNNRDRTCKKFFLGQECSSNEDDSLFILHAQPWVPYTLIKSMSMA